MAIYDDKDRFDFQCVSDSTFSEALQLHEAPVKVRCGQGHTDDVLETRSNEALAKLVFCRPDHAHRYRLNLTARAHSRASGSVDHCQWSSTWRRSWWKEIERKFILFDHTSGEPEELSGVRADRPIELCFSTAEVIVAGVDLFLTNSGAIIASHHVPNTCVLFATKARVNAEPEVFYSRPVAIDPTKIEPGTKQEEVELIIKEEAAIDANEETPEERAAHSSAVKKEEMEATGRTEVGPIESGHFLHLRTFSCSDYAFLNRNGVLLQMRYGISEQIYRRACF